MFLSSFSVSGVRDTHTQSAWEPGVSLVQTTTVLLYPHLTQRSEVRAQGLSFVVTSVGGVLVYF